MDPGTGRTVTAPSGPGRAQQVPLSSSRCVSQDTTIHRGNANPQCPQQVQSGQSATKPPGAAHAEAPSACRHAAPARDTGVHIKATPKHPGLLSLSSNLFSIYKCLFLFYLKGSKGTEKDLPPASSLPQKPATVRVEPSQVEVRS